MQAAAQDTPITAPARQTAGVLPFAITYEVIAYALLIIFALVIRLAELDSVSLSPAETAPALAAWRTVRPDTGAVVALPASPATFWAQYAGFTVLGGTELAARLLTALASLGLAFAPLAFRGRLGAARTLAFCTLLTFSPSLMLAAHFSAPVIWSLVFAAVMLWAFERFWRTDDRAYATVATVALVALCLLAEPGGIPLALIVLGAGLLALMLTASDTSNEEEAPDYLTPIRARFANWPLAAGGGLGLAIVIILATGFMTFPVGLTMVGNGLGTLLSGVGRGGLEPSLTLLYYEPLLIVFAIAGIMVTVRRSAFSFIERFFVAWLSLAVTAGLLFGLPNPVQYAVWLVIPLAGLASAGLANIFSEDRTQSMWAQLQDEDADINLLYTTRWGRVILTCVWLGLFTMFAMHLQVLGREALQVSGGDLFATIARVFQSPVPHIKGGGLWTLVTLLFMFVGFFLAASIWGSTTTWQGIALGLLGFMLFNNLGSGWFGAVSLADNPVEPWHNPSTSEQVPLLRETLLDFAARETQGELYIPITVVVDPAAGITEDSILAWTLRDFVNVQYVADVRSARAAEFVIMAQPTDAEPPLVDENGVIRPNIDLGGSYVGDLYWLHKTWSRTLLQGFDFVAWFFQRQVRVEPAFATPVLLWVRVDIYNRAPFNPNQLQEPAG